MTRAMLLAAALLGSAAGAQESSDAPRADNLQAMITIEGTCSELIVSGDDLTDRCGSVVVNTIFNDGRAGFIFTARDVATATFTGEDLPAKKGQATVDLDRVVLATFIEKKPTNVTLPANGSCVYSNVQRKEISINCAAGTHRGLFRAVFISNGKPPQISR